jgi:hypothetical protein
LKRARLRQAVSSQGRSFAGAITTAAVFSFLDSLYYDVMRTPDISLSCGEPGALPTPDFAIIGADQRRTGSGAV